MTLTKHTTLRFFTGVSIRSARVSLYRGLTRAFCLWKLSSAPYFQRAESWGFFCVEDEERDLACIFIYLFIFIKP